MEDLKSELSAEADSADNFSSLSNYDDNDEHQHRILELKKENSLLRSQFEEAVACASQLQTVQKSNQELVSKLRHITAEKEESDSRMNLLVQQIEELKQKLSEKNKQYSEYKTEEILQRSKYVEGIKNQLQNQINEVNSELQRTKDSFEKEKLVTKMYENEINLMLNSASHYFKQSFDGIKSFISFLDSHPCGITEPRDIENEMKEPQIHAQDLMRKLANLKKKYNKCKDTLMELREENESLMKENSSLKQRNAEMIVENKQVIFDMEDKFKRSNEARDVTESGYKNQISNLEKRLSEMKTDFQKLREESIQARSNFTITLDSPKPKVDIGPSSDFDGMQKYFTLRIDELNGQANNLKTKNESLNEQLRGCRSKVIELDSQLKSEQELRCKLEDRVKSLSTENKKLNETCQDYKEVTRHNEELGGKITTLKSNQMKLRQELDRMQIKLNEALADCTKKESINDQLLTQLNSCRVQLDEESSKNTQLVKEIGQLQNKIFNTPKPKEPEFPVQALHVLPPELIQLLNDVVTNSSFQHSSKITNSFKIIVKYYTDILDKVNDELFQLKRNYDTFQSEIGGFLQELGGILGKGSSQDSMTWSQDIKNEFLDAIGDLVATLSSAEVKVQQNQSVIETIQELFGSDCDDLVKIFEVMRSAYCNELNNIQEKSKQLKELKGVLKRCYKDFRCERDKYKEEISDLESKINTLCDQNEDLNKSVNKLTKEKQGLSKELNECRKKLAEVQEAQEQDSLSHALALKSNTEKAEAQIRQVVGEVNQRTLELETELDTLRKKYETTSKELKEALRQIKNNDDEILRLKETNTKCEEDFSKKLHEEREQVKQTFEDIINQLRGQLADSRNGYNRLSEEVSDQAYENTELQKKVQKLNMRIKELLKQVKTAEEQLSREKRLCEASKNAVIASMEGNAASRIEALRSQLEGKQRRMLAFIADSFRCYFNPLDLIDEQTIKQTIEKVSRDLVDLKETDTRIRKMLNATADQKSDDAVAQVLLDLRMK